eukprot:7024345-Pyramimonas_sp.AAC.1
MRKNGKRRGSVQWSIPVELLLCCIDPGHWTAARRPPRGLGQLPIEGVAQPCRNCRMEVQEVLLHTRHADRAPAAAHWPFGFALDKHSGLR